MDMDRITITVPLPPRELHPNARKHWRAKMQAKSRQRGDACLAAMSATRSKGPGWTLAEVHTTWYMARKNDSDNLIAWGKATWDGLQDAGIIQDDGGFIYMPPKQVIGARSKGERKLVIEVVRQHGEKPTAGVSA